MKNVDDLLRKIGFSADVLSQELDEVEMIYDAEKKKSCKKRYLKWAKKELKDMQINIKEIQNLLEEEPDDNS